MVRVRKSYLSALLICAVVGLSSIGFSRTVYALGDVCSNVEITLTNSTSDEIKVTKFEYFDFVADKWRTETMFGVDGHQKLEPKKSWTKTQDLEHIENDKTKFKVTFQRRIGGTKWEDPATAVTSEFICTDKMKKTVILGVTELSPAASNIKDCTTQETAEIGAAIDWGADNWSEFEEALEGFRDWPVNIGKCLRARFTENGKVVCEHSMKGLCKGNNGWASALNKKCHMCPDYLARVRALSGVENRQACYFALVTHEWGHTCERGHKTLEIIDDEAFNFWKSRHGAVTISLANCGME